MVDVSVVRDRLSAYHGTRVPRSVARFVAWLAEDPEHEALLGDRASLLPWHDLAVADASAPLPVRPTGRYDREPPEFMAFAQTGCDGEQIGVLELAPELMRDELPFVTFFPMDFTTELCLLGDELGVALTTWLAYPNVDGPRPLALPGLFGKKLPKGRWPGFEPPAFHAPHGYRFVSTSDRAGVLAPVDAFGPDVATVGDDPDIDELDDEIEHATRLLNDGFPASAIAVVRDVRAAASETEFLEPACAVWRAAALMLGRPWHAAMIDEIVTDERTKRREMSSSHSATATVWNVVIDGEAP